MFFFLEKLKS